jgi:hypothetical protein
VLGEKRGNARIVIGELLVAFLGGRAEVDNPALCILAAVGGMLVPTPCNYVIHQGSLGPSVERS